ncbi:MAG: HesA/MoeB/ThiF family protein [Planctomycetes bacterium]|nr:HesA/MoeB/ThiF family protein [Planctomycetota bacterium]
MSEHSALTDEERAIYEWQLWVAGFGGEGQVRLKNATVLVTRVGGVGGMVAMHLAAAGVGRLILAHAGDLRPSDLNRQLLMSHAGLGKSRVEQAADRLRAFNPRVEVVAVAENISDANADRLVRDADLIASCAPLFEERLRLNRAAIACAKPLVDAAMYEMEAQLTCVLPGQGPCLACLYPTPPADWNRRFPVLGAVAGTVGSLAAVEVIKILAGFGEPLIGKMLICDLSAMTFRKIEMRRDPGCRVCGHS